MEEISGTTGRIRLVVQLLAWHVYGFVGVNNVGASTVGRGRATRPAPSLHTSRPAISVPYVLSLLGESGVNVPSRYISSELQCTQYLLKEPLIRARRLMGACGCPSRPELLGWKLHRRFTLNAN
jgi:hypothetical protein